MTEQEFQTIFQAQLEKAKTSLSKFQNLRPTFDRTMDIIATMNPDQVHPRHILKDMPEYRQEVGDMVYEMMFAMFVTGYKVKEAENA